MATKSNGKAKMAAVVLGADQALVGPFNGRLERPADPEIIGNWVGPSILVPDSVKGAHWRRKHKSRVIVLRDASTKKVGVVFRMVVDDRLYEAESAEALLQKVIKGDDARTGRQWYGYIGLPYSLGALAAITTEDQIELMLIDRDCVDKICGKGVMHRDYDRGRKVYASIPRPLSGCGCGGGGFVPDTPSNRKGLLARAAKYRAARDKLQQEFGEWVLAVGGGRPLAESDIHF